MYWFDLKRVDGTVLTDARLQAHYALQWLVRVGRAYDGEGVGQSRAHLAWDEDEGVITRRLPGSIVFGLRIEDLTFVLFRDGVVDGSFSLDGADDETAGRWICEQLEFYGLPLTYFNRPLPYGLPDHAIARGATYDLIDCCLGFIELAHWISNGWAALADLGAHLPGDGIQLTSICFRPRLFNLAMIIKLETDLRTGVSEPAKRIQVGMSLGGGVRPEPYFYVSPRPGLQAEGLPAFVDIGQWHVNGAVDAVAPASHFVGEELQAHYVRNFLDQAVAISWERLRA